MRVTNLEFENFRNHKKSTLSFGDNSFIVIRGSNFAGKSTIRQGISMCVTPSTTGLDSAGKGYASKIKRGATKAVIIADLQTKHHLIQRTVTLNTNTTGRTQKTVCISDPSWSTTRFDQELEKQRAALTVALNTEAFLRMEEKEQKNLLASLALPSRYDFDREIVAGVNAVLGEGTVNFAAEPFTVINQSYKKLFDERQIVNRQVKEFLIPEALPIPGDVDSVSLQSELANLRAQRQHRMQERDRAVADANKKEQARAAAKAKIQGAIESERRREDAIRDKLLKDGQREYLLKIAQGEKELHKLQGERSACARVLDQNTTQLKHVEEIPWGAKNCPTCEQPVDGERFKEMSEKLKGWVRDTTNALARLDEKIKALGDVSDAIDALAAHDAALKELEAYDAQAAERMKKIEASQQNIEGPTLFDFAPFNEGMAECDAEIERLSGLLRPVIVGEERRKEIEIKQGQLSTLREKAAMLDRMVKYFDKDGIKAKLIGEYIGGFEHKLNGVMSAWGYACALSIEPYSFDITNAEGDTIPVRELSGAEQIIFSLAFQCAVSITAGIGMVVIDEVAMLLPGIRPMLNKRLYEMIRQGLLEQVILLVADTSDQAANLPGAAFYLVDHGEVYPLSQTSIPRKEVVNERRPEQRNIA
jgi:DNA repair exonuclease SbcCD ATPase subunit